MFVIALLLAFLAIVSDGRTLHTSREEAPDTLFKENLGVRFDVDSVPGVSGPELKRPESSRQLARSGSFKAFALLLLAFNCAAGFHVTRHSSSPYGSLSVPSRSKPRAFETLTLEDWVQRLAEVGANDGGGNAASYLNSVLATAPDKMPAEQAIRLLELMEKGGAGPPAERLPLPDTVSYACAAAAALDAGMDAQAARILDRGVQRWQLAESGSSRKKGPPRKQKTQALLTKAAEHLEVLHEDSEIIIVDKPSNMLVHAADNVQVARTGNPTLAEILLKHTDGELSRLGGEQARGVVHRIDKAVSGCVAFAKTDAAHARLVRDFFRRDIREKCYVALAASAPPDTAGNITEEVEGLPASSSYKLLQSTENSTASLVEVTMSTGRKHQVRQHLRSIGCPIFLDPLEPSFAQTRLGKKKNKKAKTTLAEVPDVVTEAVGGKKARERIFLHAKRLSLRSPAVNREVVSVEAPVPDWWLPVLTELGLEI